MDKLTFSYHTSTRILIHTSSRSWAICTNVHAPICYASHDSSTTFVSENTSTATRGGSSPEQKRERVDEIVLIPKGQFLAQHPGSVGIFVFVPNVDEGNLKGQILEISMQSLTETIRSLKEKIVGEVQLPANKQKLSGHASFLKDNMSLA